MHQLNKKIKNIQLLHHIYGKYQIYDVKKISSNLRSKRKKMSFIKLTINSCTNRLQSMQLRGNKKKSISNNATSVYVVLTLKEQTRTESITTKN